KLHFNFIEVLEELRGCLGVFYHSFYPLSPTFYHNVPRGTLNFLHICLYISNRVTKLYITFVYFRLQNVLFTIVFHLVCFLFLLPSIFYPVVYCVYTH